LCTHISRGKDKTGKGPRDIISRVNRSTTGGVSRVEIGNLLDNFKIDILSTLSSQLDTLKTKQRKEEENATLFIFFPRCRKKHPLNNIEVCDICAKKHVTEISPSIPKLKEAYNGDKEAIEKLCFVSPKKPWQPQTSGISQDPTQQFTSYYSIQQYPQ